MYEGPQRLHYLQQHSPELRLKPGDFNRIVAEMWSKLPTHKMQVYEEMSIKEKTTQNATIQAYLASKAGGAGGRDKRQARGPKAKRASKYELGETTEKDVPGQGMVTETTFMPAARGSRTGQGRL